ncbi:hypothetical protein JSE7799_00275 [Jannaschia seosinensis]|uniref:DUF4174 domain-containing protein n=1 Tax=Jannaschia seosinensis TaxID=313367 RepID=A0A0M7B4J5_9RHOB|nr:DUF4174 domain-containing protein [Jannaschia seosinensis]CUH14461.1 hypothetical protein JSE7799_00275 [Jannaschia seosinensis]
MRLATAFVSTLALALPVTAQEATGVSAVTTVAENASTVAEEPVTISEQWAQNPTQIFDAGDVDLAELQWIARPVVVFANSPRDPAFVEQLGNIVSEADQLVERDVIVIVDTDPGNPSGLRERLRPRGFMMVLIGKDGEVELRKPLPRTVREIGRSIDKMPLRLQELRDG